MKGPPTSRYSEWLKGKTKSITELETYIQSLGEWFCSEYKANTNEDGCNIRKAVAAMANKHGGELFIGISDDKKTKGVQMSSQEISQILSQEKAPHGVWYITDLNETVHGIIDIPITENLFVYVLDVRNQDLPVFVQENNTMKLFIRDGDRSMPVDSFQALDWSRNLTREKILTTCYFEFKTITKRISSTYHGYVLGLGIKFPYLEKRMEDGTLYRYLTPEDIITLLGERKGSSGYIGGLYNHTFELIHRIQMIYRTDYEESETGIYTGIKDVISRYEDEIEDKIRQFQSYLKTQKIHIED